jgi:hypothetical protein
MALSALASVWPQPTPSLASSSIDWLAGRAETDAAGRFARALATQRAVLMVRMLIAEIVGISMAAGLSCQKKEAAVMALAV